MYWHNGRSLGHTAESAKIGRALVEAGHSVTGLTGAFKGLDQLPTGMDVLKLPGFVNYDKDTGWDAGSVSDLPYDDLFRLRTELATVYLDHYRPEVLLVNHLPFGAESELRPALEKRADRLNVLMLRGILFDRDKTRREYFTDEITAWIDRTFDLITVHTDPAVFRLDEFYEVPPELSGRLVHTGYLTERTTVDRVAARARLGIAEHERLVVASMGGGQGALPIWTAILQALRADAGAWDRALLVTGPYLEPASVAALLDATATMAGVEVVPYTAHMLDLMAASDVFLGAAGSSMLGEAISVGCNLIAIPRQVREPEQRLHAQLLADRGLMRAAPLDEVLDGALDRLLPDALAAPLSSSDAGLLMDGARAYPGLLTGLVGR